MCKKKKISRTQSNIENCAPSTERDIYATHRVDIAFFSRLVTLNLIRGRSVSVRQTWPPFSDGIRRFHGRPLARRYCVRTRLAGKTGSAPLNSRLLGGTCVARSPSRAPYICMYAGIDGRCGQSAPRSPQLLTCLLSFIFFLFFF